MAISDLVFLFPRGFVDQQAEIVRRMMHDLVDRSSLRVLRAPPTSLELARLSGEATAHLAASGDPMIHELRAVFHARPDGALDVHLLRPASRPSTERISGLPPTADRAASGPSPAGPASSPTVAAHQRIAGDTEVELDAFEADELTPPRLPASSAYRDRDAELHRLAERVAALEAQRAPRRLLADLDKALETMVDDDIEQLYALIERHVLRLAEALDRIKKRQARP
jgi:hypothetical protein